jgi:ribonuclease HII
MADFIDDTNTIIKKKELTPFYNVEGLEIGIDEAGRGPLFGRVYVAIVMLPKSYDFKYNLLKDSKKFTSNKKILEVNNYIKEHAKYVIEYAEADEIDRDNILQTTLNLFHRAIDSFIKKYSDTPIHTIIVDGDRFKPYKHPTKGNIIAYHCIEGGDNKYCSIAGASILAKVARDEYIFDMCKKYPYLDELYGMSKHKGYGTKIHMEALKKHGISQWHRKTYGICKTLPELSIS